MTQTDSKIGLLNDPGTEHGWLRSPQWVRLSMGAGGFAFAGSIVSLLDTRVYENLTAVFLAQALAQDLANLAIAPLLLVAAVLALRGSLRAYLVWLGAVAFTFYNYVIYTFAIPFGPMFPLWVVVLGLALFSLIGGLQAVDAKDVSARFARPRTVATSAWFLLVVAGLFALLWLSEDIPALLSGSTPKSVVDLALPTNPVHILDYVFFLPAAVLTGIGLFRGTHFAYPAAPAFFVFLLLTCLPILITPFVQHSVAASAGMLGVIGLLAVALATVLVVLLRTVGATEVPKSPALVVPEVPLLEGVEFARQRGSKYRKVRASFGVGDDGYRESTGVRQDGKGHGDVSGGNSERHNVPN
ncbi:hypothetical protein ABIB54_003378 [Frigoribacterium sp. UYMn621]